MKLGRVGPIDNRPSTDLLRHSVQFFCVWLKTHFFFLCDRWQVTCDRWHVKLCVRWSFSQNFSSQALTVWDLCCCEYLRKRMPDWLNELSNWWINYGYTGSVNKGNIVVNPLFSSVTHCSINIFNIFWVKFITKNAISVKYLSHSMSSEGMRMTEGNARKPVW